MSSTPDCVTSRSESDAKRCGSQLSMAMFDITRGPSRKPAWAATKSSAASMTSVPGHEPAPHREAARAPVPGEVLEQHRVHGLPLHRRDPEEEVGEQDAASGHRE